MAFRSIKKLFPIPFQTNVQSFCAAKKSSFLVSVFGIGTAIYFGTICHASGKTKITSTVKIATNNSQTSITNPNNGPVIYVNVFSHNEDPFNPDTPRLSDSESTATYWAFRDVTLNAANWLHEHNIPYSFQSDWNFLNALLKNEVNAKPTSTLNQKLKTTSGKNLVKYMAENLGVEIDSHCHQNADFIVSPTAYNAVDVNYLFSLAGVTASNVLGGTVINDPGYGNWPQYKNQVNGSVYPDQKWTFGTIMGGGTQSHTGQVYTSGIWTPLEPTDSSTYDNYYQIDSTSNLIAVGSYLATKENAQVLLTAASAGTIPTGKMLTMGFAFNISDLVIGKYGELDENDRIAGGVVDEQFVERWFETNLLPLIDLRNSGQVQFSTFNQSVEIWRSQFGSQSFVCKQSRPDAHDCVIP